VGGLFTFRKTEIGIQPDRDLVIRITLVIHANDDGGDVGRPNELIGLTGFGHGGAEIPITRGSESAIGRGSC
jgi:hypothetical protein